MVVTQENPLQVLPQRMPYSGSRAPHRATHYKENRALDKRSCTRLKWEGAMRVTAMEQDESANDVLCDVCGDSTRVEGYGLQFGTLCASWGYGSTHDGERYEVHLCEHCFFRTLSGLRRERMVNFMFSDADQDLSDFGRVARDDFFNDRA